MSDKPEQQARDFVEDTVAKAGDIAVRVGDRVEDIVDDTVDKAKAVFNDLDDTSEGAASAAREAAVDAYEEVAEAYKRNPGKVIAIAAIAVAALAVVVSLLGKRR